ncbi:hypothetical protein TNCV_4860811 [Trichonephila clavipes]|nr:hypothetical protein TNCV_4860811 [Trichonephila clavipes]
MQTTGDILVSSDESLTNFGSKYLRPVLSIIVGQFFKYWVELLAVCQSSDTVLIRVGSMIESNTNSNEFRSKDGTVVRIPDDDFNIIPWSVAKNTIPCSTRIRTTTICANNQGLIGYVIYYFKFQLSESFRKREQYCSLYYYEDRLCSSIAFLHVYVFILQRVKVIIPLLTNLCM